MILQPENIVVEHASSQPVIKLTDFGDAVQLSPASSYIHPLLGSPEFSAPELVLGQPASLVSDIWSLGLLHTIVSDGIIISKVQALDLCLQLALVETEGWFTHSHD